MGDTTLTAEPERATTSISPNSEEPRSTSEALDTYVCEEDGSGSSAEQRTTRRDWREVAGIGWVVAAGLAVLVPALSQGASLGPYQQLVAFDTFRNARLSTHGNLLQTQDLLLLTIPWHALAWTQVHAGHLPLWNPYNVLGMPLAFNWESAPFSLQSLIGYLGPLSLVLTITVVLNLVIAGTGVYVLCRVLRIGPLGAAMAGTVFELSGPFTGLLGWQDPAVMCWAGWLFAVTVLILRGRHRLRYVAAFAVILAFAGYAGQPEDLFLLLLSCGLFVLTLFVVRLLRRQPLRLLVRPIGDLLLAVVGGLALFAPVALPALQLSHASVRSKWEPIDNVTAAQAQLHFANNAKNVGQALSFHDLTHVLFQTFDGFPARGSYWFSDRILYMDSVAYIGVIALVLAVVAVAIRRRNPVVLGFAVLTACMFCLVFVPPVVSIADRLPFVGTILWNRALIPMCFGVAILAGAGTDLLARRHADRRVRQWVFGGFAAVAAVLAAVWLFGRGHLPAVEAAVRQDSFVAPVFGTLAGLAAATYVWRANTSPAKRTPVVAVHRAGQAAAGLLIVIETVLLVGAAAPLISSGSQFLPSTPQTTALQRVAGSSVVGFGTSECVYPPAIGIKVNLNAAYAVQEFGSYDPITPLAYFSSWRAASGQPNPYIEDNIFCPAITSATLARRYGVGLILEPPTKAGPPGTVYDTKIGTESAYRVPGAAAATLTALDRGGSLPATDAPGSPVPTSHPDPASWTLHTDATAREVLRLRITDVPGWQATIDGHPLALAPYAGIMLQALIPPGRHSIELHYWPPTFNLGLVLAGAVVAAFAVACLVALIRARRRRTVSTPSEE
jgi:hypothetical protein